ncbi:TRAP transporter small permease [Puniceibacterium sp. IMCC21224]|uniref:TRAP transporter small permease n=1 Tax=Puniceibacterium sp. IMCC21224 TaxID=1618204 RepID=UPI00064D7B9B|nr:TRAP transporter small permease subunit [Puniceibacterium sp. IMCC21224]KMK64944.1 TRAP-type C4-dicarboxylate transport system, small permease component [Puniceibacterium sp. IMCC21224]
MSEFNEAELPDVDLPAGWFAVDRGLVLITKITLAGIGLGFVGLVSSEVVSRFFFDRSMAEVNAIARILLVWFFMLGSGLALRQGAHVGIDLLRRSLRRRGPDIVQVLAELLFFVFLLEMLWASYLAVTSAARQFEGTLGISMVWVMAAFPAGFGLLTYHWGVMVVDRLRRRQRAAA